MDDQYNQDIRQKYADAQLLGEHDAASAYRNILENRGVEVPNLGLPTNGAQASPNPALNGSAPPTGHEGISIVADYEPE